MNTNNPRISVFILTYNRAHLVERSIKSVLAQTYKDYELVLVDNGSTDNTTEIFKKYENLEHVRISNIEKNIGFARGFNYCLDQIKGEWFALVGDDDAIVPEALEKLFDKVDNMDPTLTAVNSNGLDSSTGELSGIGLYEDQYLPLEITVSKCDGNFWGMTKSELLKDIRLNIRIPGLENTFWYRLNAITKRYYIHEPLITYYTDHGPTETQKQDKGMDIKALLYRELLEEPFFWDVLKKYNKKQYKERCLKAMHFLKATGDLSSYSIYKSMLKDDSPGIKDVLYAEFINISNPWMLDRLYRLKKLLA